ncbi:MAG: ATP-binding cassette domain-containing protein, partial [Clostridia bacterium]|nr:ATP-binding cassette domain-containing protein [Clostridia bacterium]
MFKFDNISYTYHTKSGETTAVKDLSFTVDDGQFVSVIGPSGCGKTTILSISAGLLYP